MRDAAPSIGSWLTEQIRAETGERVIARWPANRVRRRRAVGGLLFVTNARLIFLPHQVERLLGMKPWIVSLHDVTGLSELPKRGVMGSAARKRLAIEVRNEPREVFVVNRLEDRLRLLRDAVRKEDG